MADRRFLISEFVKLPQSYICYPKLAGRCSSVVEHFLGKEEVASSILINGSKYYVGFRIFDFGCEGKTKIEEVEGTEKGKSGK